MNLTKQNLEKIGYYSSRKKNQNQFEYPNSSCPSQKNSDLSSWEANFQQQKSLKGEISGDVKKQIKKAFEDYESGKINQDNFVYQIRNKWNLTTNSHFDQQMKKVQPNFNDIMKGIDKHQFQHNHNLKPNTYDPHISRINGYTQSLPKYLQEQVQTQVKMAQDPFKIEINNKIREFIQGRMNHQAFKTDMQSMGIRMDDLDKHFRQYQSSNDIQQNQICKRLLKNADEQNIEYTGENPNYQNQKLLSAYYSNYKSPGKWPNEIIISNEETREKKDLQNQFRQTAKGELSPTKGKWQPKELMRASLNHGNIVTWKRNKYNYQKQLQMNYDEEISSSVKKNFQKGQDKFRSNFAINMDIADQIAEDQVNNTKKKNVKEHIGTGNIISWKGNTYNVHSGQPQKDDSKRLSIKNISHTKGVGNILTWEKTTFDQCQDFCGRR